MENLNLSQVQTWAKQAGVDNVKDLQEAIKEQVQGKVGVQTGSKWERKTMAKNAAAQLVGEMLKKRGKPLVDRTKKAAPPQKAEKTEETKKVEEGEEKPLKEILAELKETLKETGERDAEQTRYEIADYIITRASQESSENAPDAIVRYLINPIGPYGKRPDAANEPLSIAIKEVERDLKALKAEHGDDHQDVKEAEALKGKLQEARSRLMKNISTEIGSPALGVPTSRTITHKSQIKENLLSKIPLFKNENELKKALKELDDLTDPEAHKQWCLKYDYEQFLTLVAMYNREASEVINSEAGNITPGLLNNKIKVMQNNMSLKSGVRLFANEMNLVMKLSDQYKVFTPEPSAPTV
jgi:hypothetical protein